MILNEVRLPKGFFKVVNSFTLPGKGEWDAVFNKDEYLYLDSQNKDVLGYATQARTWRGKEVDFKYLLSPIGYQEFTKNIEKLDPSLVPNANSLTKQTKAAPKEFTTVVGRVSKRLNDLNLDPSTKIKVSVLEKHLVKLSGRQIRFEDYATSTTASTSSTAATNAKPGTIASTSSQELINDSNVQIKRGINIVTTPDFVVKFDYEGPKATLNWIHSKTTKYKGKDVFKSLADYLTTKGVKTIGAWGTKGVVYGVEAYGYYVMMKWGFVPEDMDKVNALIGTDYPNFEQASRDLSFWTKWKEDGKDYFGNFDLKPNSLSWQLFNKNSSSTQ